MKTVEELEALLESVTRERDVETNSALMFESDWKDACRERDELRAWQLQVAEPTGFVLRAFGSSDYDVAEPAVLVNAWRALERERDELRAIVGAGGLTYSEGETNLRVKIVEFAQAAESAMRERDLSLSAWESAGMSGRDAQSAMLELARQLEEAQERIELLTELRDEERDLNEHFHQEIQAKHTAAEQAKRERDEARETILALTTAMAEKDLEIATLTAALDERDLEAERSLEQYDRLMHQLADATNESTHFQVMCKREGEEIERLTRQAELLTDERDDLLVRVANQDAELRATREAYNGARAEVLQLKGKLHIKRIRLRLRLIDEVRSDAYRRGAEAMREACASAMHPIMRSMISRTEAAQTIRALPIPEEP